MKNKVLILVTIFFLLEFVMSQVAFAISNNVLWLMTSQLIAIKTFIAIMMLKPKKTSAHNT